MEPLAAEHGHDAPKARVVGEVITVGVHPAHLHERGAVMTRQFARPRAPRPVMTDEQRAERIRQLQAGGGKPIDNSDLAPVLRFWASDARGLMQRLLILSEDLDAEHHDAMREIVADIQRTAGRIISILNEEQS